MQAYAKERILGLLVEHEQALCTAWFGFYRRRGSIIQIPCKMVVTNMGVLLQESYFDSLWNFMSMNPLVLISRFLGGRDTLFRIPSTEVRELRKLKPQSFRLSASQENKGDTHVVLNFRKEDIDSFLSVTWIAEHMGK